MWVNAQEKIFHFVKKDHPFSISKDHIKKYFTRFIDPFFIYRNNESLLDLCFYHQNETMLSEWIKLVETSSYRKKISTFKLLILKRLSCVSLSSRQRLDFILDSLNRKKNTSAKTNIHNKFLYWFSFDFNRNNIHYWYLLVHLFWLYPSFLKLKTTDNGLEDEVGHIFIQTAPKNVLLYFLNGFPKTSLLFQTSLLPHCVLKRLNIFFESSVFLLIQKKYLRDAKEQEKYLYVYLSKNQIWEENLVLFFLQDLSVPISERLYDVLQMKKHEQSIFLRKNIEYYIK